MGAGRRSAGRLRRRDPGEPLPSCGAPGRPLPRLSLTPSQWPTSCTAVSPSPNLRRGGAAVPTGGRQSGGGGGKRAPCAPPGRQGAAPLPAASTPFPPRSRVARGHARQGVHQDNDAVVFRIPCIVWGRGRAARGSRGEVWCRCAGGHGAHAGAVSHCAAAGGRPAGPPPPASSPRPPAPAPGAGPLPGQRAPPGKVDQPRLSPRKGIRYRLRSRAPPRRSAAFMSRASCGSHPSVLDSDAHAALETRPTSDSAKRKPQGP
jgi:hypothetical protein